MLFAPCTVLFAPPAAAQVPPFDTNNIFQLVNQIVKDPVKWSVLYPPSPRNGVYLKRELVAVASKIETKDMLHLGSPTDHSSAKGRGWSTDMISRR